MKEKGEIKKSIKRKEEKGDSRGKEGLTKGRRKEEGKEGKEDKI